MLDRVTEEYAGFANEVADLARAILSEAAGGARRPQAKSDASPVTETDRQVERRIRERIAERYPRHGMLGEEYGAEGLEEEFVWVIDPIDGTKAFVGGFAVYGTLIALARGGTPILGVIDNPVTGDRWIGSSGRPTTLNGRVVRTGAVSSLADAIMANGNPEPFDTHERHSFTRLRSSVKWCVYGGSCTAYGRVADGSLDISIDAGLDAYDYCALVPIVSGAGGMITDWQGRNLNLSSGHLCVASGNQALHARVLERLAA